MPLLTGGENMRSSPRAVKRKSTTGSGRQTSQQQYIVVQRLRARKRFGGTRGESTGTLYRLADEVGLFAEGPETAGQIVRQRRAVVERAGVEPHAPRAQRPRVLDGF